MKKKSIKQKKTTRRKNNKKTKKNKTLIGGRPKVNFPYTYFIIDYNIFNRYPILNSYLNVQTNACNDMSSGKNPEFTDTDSRFLNDENETCIIVLKYDDAFNVNNNNDLLADLNFLNKILGHAKLIHYESLSLLGIYNVCLHTFNIIRNNISQQYIHQRKESKPGYGSVLFNCIYTGILLLKISFNTIWLGIDINNVQFKKVAWLYTSKGFGNPIFSNISPDGKTLPIYFIQLTSNKTYVNNKDDALIPYHETIDLYHQISDPLGREGIFSFEFSFDKTAILSLRLMPFLSFSENKDLVGIEEYSKQRETAGRFLNYKTYTHTKDNTKDNTKDKIDSVGYVLSLETVGEQSIKYTIGEPGSVDFIEGERVFHTHPYLNYSLYNALIGPPSGGDIMIFLQSIINDIKKPMTQPKQFSSIISIEGIYIISLSIDGIRQLKNGKIPFLNNLENSYEYPMSERYYDWNKYSTDTTIQVDTVKNEVEKYLNWFNKVNASFDNYFQIIFMPWNKLDEKTIFQIYYYNGNRLNINQMNNSTGVYPEVNLRKTVPPQPTRDNVTTTGRITNLPQPYTTKMY